MALKDSLTGELKYESSLTKKMLEKVPFEKKDWKPHEKSMTLGRLATHVAEIPHWISRVVTMDEFDFLAPGSASSTASSHEELMTLFGETLSKAIADLQTIDDESFNKTWTVKRGDQVIFTTPKKIAVRGWALNHMIHHRGQLSVYLRLLGIPVPGMYGPSADERI